MIVMVYLQMSACSISFLWKTSLVCPPIAEQCSISRNGNTYDLSILSRDQGSWNLTDVDGNWFVYFLTKSAKFPGGGANAQAFSE
jgi:hypothetical protein